MPSQLLLAMSAQQACPRSRSVVNPPLRLARIAADMVDYLVAGLTAGIAPESDDLRGTGRPGQRYADRQRGRRDAVAPMTHVRAGGTLCVLKAA